MAHADALWWTLWVVELYVAVVLTWSIWRFSRLFRRLDDVHNQLEFYRTRSLALDERLRHYARKRDGKGRFCGRVG